MAKQTVTSNLWVTSQRLIFNNAIFSHIWGVALLTNAVKEHSEYCTGTFCWSSAEHLKVQWGCCLCESSHADTLIIPPVSVERPALPQGKAEVSFLTLAASTDANDSSRQTDRQTDRRMDSQAGRPKRWVHSVTGVYIVDFHELGCFVVVKCFVTYPQPCKKPSPPPWMHIALHSFPVRKLARLVLTEVVVSSPSEPRTYLQPRLSALQRTTEPTVIYQAVTRGFKARMLSV